MLDLLEEFRSILSALAADGVEFAVCGGLAVAIHARPRATQDVDLLLPRDQAEAARSVLRRLGYTIDGGLIVLRPDVVEMHRLSKPDDESGDLLSVDLLLVTPEFAPIWDGRQHIAWEHGEVPVVSPAGLIAMKRLRGSGLDLDDIRTLEEGENAGSA